MAISYDEHDGASGPAAYTPMAEINMTPFVDVILVLLVIFMIAAPLMVQGVAVTLPKTQASAVGQVTQPMIVTLARDRSLYIRDERIEPSALVDRLKQIRQSEGDTVVYVRADRTAAYGDVMELLGRVGSGGYAKVSLLAQPIGAAEPTKAR